MKITILGATGNAGSRVVVEALSRGHEVTAVEIKPYPKPIKATLLNNKIKRDVAGNGKDVNGQERT